MKSWSFVVTGRLAFPMDMLRYDACYPYQSEDAVQIEESIHRNDPLKERRITLVSHVGPPQEGRWSSFSWHVSEVRKRS